MNKKTITRVFSAVICTCMMLGIFTLPAYANSAQTYFEGVDSTGAIMPDKESPIIVEKERLTFDIAEFPQEYFYSEEDFSEYSAKVTAEYTFYNPSEYTVTAKLLFPFGHPPSYSNYEHDDTNKFYITVNGEAISKNIRHTRSYRYDQFELEQDLALISDGFVADSFYSPDMTVTRYKFVVSGVDIEKYRAADVGFDIPKGLGNYRIYFPNQNGMHIQKDGDMRVHTGVWNNGSSFELFVFGEPFTEMPVWTAYEDGGVKDREKIDGKVELVDTETTTFKEFALANRAETSAVSEIDWYNAVVAEFKNVADRGNEEYPMVYYESYRFEDNLMRWYEYEITLAPEERIVNTVTAPMYPTINSAYDPPIYEYTYLLSPAKTWKSFGALEIVINTPYYLTENSIEGFERVEGGYSLNLNGLPDGELNFTLSESAEPKVPVDGEGIAVGFIFLIAIVGVGYILITGIVVVVVLICVKKKRKNKTE